MAMGHFPFFLLPFVAALSFVDGREPDCAATAEETSRAQQDHVTLLQATRSTVGEQHTSLLTDNTLELTKAAKVAAPWYISGHSEMWPISLLHSRVAGSSSAWYTQMQPSMTTSIRVGLTTLGVVGAILGLKFLFPGSGALRAISLGTTYVIVSAAVIESNKWLMQPGNFPYPIALTTNHMFMSVVLANCLRFVCPWAFPALEKFEVSRWFFLKMVPMGVAFSLSIVCGNAAYKYLSVSFLQCMKQCNLVIIYSLSVVCGLEALRRCSVILLAGTLCGTMLAIHGELHFQLIGFILQVLSSLSEATKVIIQGLLMSGSSKLDPLTMVLFMAPTCLLANLVPLTVIELTRWSEITTQLLAHLPFILGNACLAFVLNVIVAACIKQLSPVGYLLCGIVKDVCIIVSSSFFLGESLQLMQIVGFCLALSGVASYSLYKQNVDCFEEDNLIAGFVRVADRLTTKNELAEGASKVPKGQESQK